LPVVDQVEEKDDDRNHENHAAVEGVREQRADAHEHEHRSGGDEAFVSASVSAKPTAFM
jgi:hypothetical protein